MLWLTRKEIDGKIIGRYEAILHSGQRRFAADKEIPEVPRTDRRRQTKIYSIMSVILNRGKELIRINPSNQQKLEVSINGVRVWSMRFYGLPNVGTFID